MLCIFWSPLHIDKVRNYSQIENVELSYKSYWVAFVTLDRLFQCVVFQVQVQMYLTICTQLHAFLLIFTLQRCCVLYHSWGLYRFHLDIAPENWAKPVMWKCFANNSNDRDNPYNRLLCESRLVHKLSHGVFFSFIRTLNDVSDQTEEKHDCSFILSCYGEILEPMSIMLFDPLRRCRGITVIKFWFDL